MSGRIHLSAPDVGAAEQLAVQRAMESGWIAPLGPEVDAFEHELAARVGVAHGVALSSGTAALHLGLLALGIGRGDVVVTSTMTFAATVNAIVYTGATPVLVDCDPVDGNIDPALLQDALVTLEREGTPASSVVPVDLLGRSVDHTAIAALTEPRGIPVLADAAESLGAAHDGRPVGSFGRASAVSFNGNKIMTTSGGGMLLTDDAAVAARVRHLSTQARQPVAHYEHTEVGFNYRLSNVLAAIGRAQLVRLDAMIARRRAIRRTYEEVFADVPGVELFQRDGDDADNCWLTSVLIDEGASGISPATLRDALARDDIEARPLWKPMHRQPVFSHLRAFTSGASDELFRRGVTLPSGSGMDDDDLRRVVTSIERLVGAKVAR